MDGSKLKFQSKYYEFMSIEACSCWLLLFLLKTKHLYFSLNERIKPLFIINGLEWKINNTFFIFIISCDKLFLFILERKKKLWSVRSKRLLGKHTCVLEEL